MRKYIFSLVILLLLTITKTSFAVANNILQTKGQTTKLPQDSIPGDYYSILNERTKEIFLNSNSPSINLLNQTDLPNWKDLLPSNRPRARGGSALVKFPPRHSLILFGGWGGWDVGSLCDTWEYDGSNWTQLDMGVCTHLHYHKMIYDERNQRIVRFGGMISGSGTENWYATNRMDYFSLWGDTPRWLPLPNENTPPARQSFGMAYDTARERILIFGGANQFGIFLNDTWEFDGNAWRQIMTVNSPSIRYDPAMAYDSVRNKIVLYGGYSQDLGFLDDTWEYDSETENWINISTGSKPLPLSSAVFDFDPFIESAVLFGGTNFQSDDLDKTYEYDGANWQEIFPTNHPSSRERSSIAFYPEIGSLVLFGGIYWDNALQEWIYLDDTWQYETLIPGDINNDGIVDYRDVLFLLSHYTFDFPVADLNHDHKVNSVDFCLLINLIH